MAGIGFRLRKILGKGTYSSLAAAYFYGAVISSGPWLISVLSIGLLSALTAEQLGKESSLLFRTLIIYTYMGSLLFTGPFVMPVTRFLADRMYRGDFSCLLPGYRYLCAFCLTGGGAAAALFYLCGGLPLPLALGAAALFQAVTLTWVAMIFLSAARDYSAVARAFGLGYLFGIAAGFAGAQYYQLPGMLWGFAAGMFLLAALLSHRVAREFPSYQASDPTSLSYLRKMPWLAVCGFCTNASLWADKIIYWIYDGAKAAPGPFFAPQNYDTCFFAAYLTIIPTLTVFLIRVETSFYRAYADFLGAISGGGSLASIEERKEGICANLRLSLARLLKVQGFVTAACLGVAPYLVEWLGLPPGQIPAFRIALLAALVQGFFLTGTVILLYFDWQRLAGLLALTALLLNTALTLLFLTADPIYQGFGCLFAFLTTLCLAGVFLERKMRHLVFETFTRSY